MSKKYTIFWTKSAQKNLDSISDYITEDNPKSALKSIHRIKEKTGILANNPNAGRIVPELLQYGISNYREIVVRPWRVMYKIANETVHILLVIDGRRNVEDILFERLIDKI